MNMTFPEQPILSKPDSGSTLIHSNSTITASGSSVISGIGSKEVTLVVNVTATPTGTTPTLTYTLQEVDPGNLTSVFGSTSTTAAINAIGVYTLSLGATVGGAVKISWTIGGGSPSFTGVYATTSSKVGTASNTSGAVVVVDASTGTNNSAIPTSSTQVGGSDGTNLQAARVFDADSGAGAQYVLGTVLRKSASGGSVEAGTSSDPLRVDPTGTTTQPVSGTVTANVGTTNGLALDATLTGNNQRTRLTDGTNLAAVKAASTAAVASDPALVVVVSPNNSVAVTAAALPLPAGASTSANQTTLGSQTTKINDGTNTATVKAASTAAVASDTAIVVAISPNNSITATNPSVGTNNAAVPASSTQVGGSDGTNLQAARVFDADSGGGTQYVLGTVLRKSASGGSVEAGTSSDPLRVDPTGTTTQPISAATLPLPTGAATETTLGTRLADATFTARINTLGQKTMANSTPVVLSSDQTVIPVSDNGGSLTVDGTVTANIGTTNGLALDATLTGGTQTTRITDGTNTATVKAASTAAVAADKAVVVAISPNNSVAVTGTVTATNPSVGTNNAAIPASSTQVGGSDGTNIQAARVFDADSGAGAQYVLGTVLRKSASGGSVEAGTSSDPLRTDPTGTTTQPVSDAGGSLTVDSTQLPAALVGARLDINNGAWLGSTAPTVGSKTSANSVPVVIASDQGAVTISGTVTSNIGTTNGLALDATLTGGTAKSVNRGGAKGATTAADVTSTAEGTDHQALDIQVYHGGTAINPTAIRALTSSDVVTSAQGTAAAVAGAWPVKVTDGTNSMPTADTVARSSFHRITDGTNTAAVKAASTAAIATDPAIVVAISPNNSLTVGNASVGVNGAAIPASSTLVAGSDGVNLQPIRVVTDGNISVARTAVGSFSSASSTQLDVNGMASVGMQVSGTWSATLVFEGSMDGTGSWFAIPVVPISAFSTAPITTIAVNGNWWTPCAGLSHVRIRASAYTSGTITCRLLGSPSASTFHAGNPARSVTDGTNTATVKAASTAAVASDTALVVAISPNNPLSVSGTADATGTGALGALNAAVQVTTAGLSAVGFQLAAGTLVGTIIPEVSFDGGTTWNATFFTDPTTGIKASSVVFSIANTATARTIVGVGGSGLTRVRVSAYTSGTANITVRASLVEGNETLERFATSGTGYTTLTSPLALAQGMVGQVTSYGTLKVTTEGSELFVEPFDGTTIDTTNRWTQSLVTGGTMTQASGSLTMTTSTVASRAAALTSQNQFRAIGLGFQIFGASLQLEAVALTNNHRFWGMGTQPGSWAATTPIQDGVGFEQDTTGAMNAVTYNAGTRTIAAVLTRPTDGLNHRYAMYVRADLVFWYVDTLEVPVASASWPPLGQQNLPIRLHSINHTSPPASGPTFVVMGVGLTETSHSGVQISDGNFAWRKAAVKPSTQAVSGSDSALAVSVSPNSLASNYNGSVISYDSGIGASGVPNPWYWQTMLSGTMDVITSTGGVTINSVSAVVTNGSYGGVVTQRFLPMDAPSCSTFVLRGKTASANSFVSFGMGTPTFVTPTTLSGTGAYFVINGTTSTLSYRVVGAISGTILSGTLVTQLDDTAYYTCRIFLGNNRGLVRFVVELGSTVLSDVTVAVPSTDPYVSPAGLNTQAFLHLFNNAAVGTAPVARLAYHYMVSIDSDRGRTMAEQRAGSGMTSHVIPYSATSNLTVAEAAPATGVPNNLGVLYNTLGGEFLLTTAASGETIRGVFGYQVPTGVTLYITDIMIPPYSVSTTLGATVNMHDWFVLINGSTTTYAGSTVRIPLGTYTAASGAAAGTIFNGQALVLNYTTPLVVQGGKYVLISVKFRSANATGAIRGTCFINGYYE
jgi:hypothetical protein